MLEENIVGRRVYQHHRPMKPGIVLEDLGNVEVKRADQTVYVSSFHKVRVQWVNGKEEVITTAYLRDFDQLIADHQKKLNTHLSTLEKLKELEAKTNV